MRLRVINRTAKRPPSVRLRVCRVGHVSFASSERNRYRYRRSVTPLHGAIVRALFFNIRSRTRHLRIDRIAVVAGDANVDCATITRNCARTRGSRAFFAQLQFSNVSQSKLIHLVGWLCYAPPYMLTPACHHRRDPRLQMTILSRIFISSRFSIALRYTRKLRVVFSRAWLL